MTASPEISIIIPLYNTEQWLGTAFESVMLQEGPSWELLAVDDGSTDGSARLVEQYAERDKRIRLLNNVGLKGSGGARNTALREARGKSVIFLDSDDALFPGVLRLLHGLMEKSGYPVVRGTSTFFCHQRWLAGGPVDTSGRVEISEVGYPTFSFCSHLFRTDFLAAHDFSFPEDLFIGQDSVFLWQVYLNLSAVPVIHSPVFLYRINHKRPNISPSNSKDFINSFIRIRQSCTDKGKNTLIEPLLKTAFISEWVRELYPVYRESRDSALEFMKGCIFILSGYENAIVQELHNQIGGQAEEFLRQCRSENPEGMLVALEHAGCIKPDRGYMGVPRTSSGLGWQGYRLARRILSLTSLSDKNRRSMLYLYMLKRNSRRRLRGLPTTALREFQKTGVEHAPQ